LDRADLLSNYCSYFSRDLNPALQDSEGMTCLHYASQNEKSEVLIKILENAFGIETLKSEVEHIRDKKGNRPIDYLQNESVSSTLYKLTKKN
jgi:hypothetical protein